MALNEAEVLSRLTGVETELRSLAKHIEASNITAQTVHTLALELATSTKHLEFLAERVADQEGRIKEIEREPGVKWELSVKVIITAVISGVVGAAVAKFLLG